MAALTSYLRRNPRLVAGLAILLGLVLFWLIGSALIDLNMARPLSGPPDMEPSAEYLLGRIPPAGSCCRC